MNNRIPSIVFVSSLLASTALGQSTGSSPTEVDDSNVVVLQPFNVYSGSKVTALNSQKESNRIGNFISSDMFGGLPDDSIGEALNRITGINVVGEDQISIRGVEGKYNAVQLDGNGLAQASNSTGAGRGSDTRNFDVSSVPVEAISGIEVIKSLTADLDADSIGGQINMVTTNSFDRRAQVLRWKTEYRYDEESGEPGWGANLSYGRVLNDARTVGVLFNLSLRDESVLFDRVELRQSNLPPLNSDGTAKVPSVSDIDPRDAPHSIFRATLSGSLDWKLSDRTQLYLKPFYNYKLTDQEELRTRVRGLNSTRNRVVLDENRVQMDEFRLERLNRYRPDQEYSTARLTLGGDTAFANAKLSYSLSWTSSANDVDEFRTDFVNPTAERRRWRVTYDNTDRLSPTLDVRLIADPSVTFGNSDLARQGMELTRLRFLDFTSDEDELIARLDYEIDLQRDDRTTLKFGAKFRDKNRENRLSIDDYRPLASAFGRIISENDFPTYRSSNTLGGIYANIGSFVGIDPVLALFNAERSKFDATYGGEFSTLFAKLYDAGESITSLYGMGTMQRGNLTLVGGVRYEHTDIDYTWRGSLLAPPRSALPRLNDTPGGSSYDNLFPSVVATWRLQDRHVFRAAYSATIARPDYEDLVPFNLADVQNAWGTYVSNSDIDVGNPNLRPQTADNFDVAYELYYGRNNSFSVGVFHKELADFQVTRTRNVSITHPIDPLNPSSPLETEILRSNQEINGSSQKITGVEVSWTQGFAGILPSPFDGLGFSANYTYITGEEKIPEFDTATGAVIGESVSDRLTNQPETIYNLQLYWEKGDFSARFSYNHVAEVKRNVFDVAFPVFQAERDVMDASLQYRLNDRFRLVLDVKNIGNEPRRLIYNTIQAFPESYALSERQWVFGVRGSF